MWKNVSNLNFKFRDKVSRYLKSGAKRYKIQAAASLVASKGTLKCGGGVCSTTHIKFSFKKKVKEI